MTEEKRIAGLAVTTKPVLVSCPACEGRGWLASTTAAMGDVWQHRVTCPFCEGRRKVTEAFAESLRNGRKAGVRALELLKMRSQLQDEVKLTPEGVVL